MSQPVDDYDDESLSNAELVKLLQRLDAEELHVSELCSALHRKLEILQAQSDDTTESASEMESTLRMEREISVRRLELQQQITELRIERSRRLSSLRSQSPLAAVEWRVRIA